MGDRAHRTGHRPGRLRWSRAAIGVIMAGSVGLIVDLALLWTLAVVLGVPRPAAAAVSFAASALVNFTLNRMVFHGGGNDLGRQGRRYFALFGINLVMTALSVPLGAGVLEAVWPADLALLAAKGATVLLLLTLNTVLYRIWVFAPTHAVAFDGKVQ